MHREDTCTPARTQVCEYENVCADLPGPALGEGLGYASQTDGLYFVGSNIIPSYAKRGGGGWPADREHIAKVVLQDSLTNNT